MTPIFIHIIKWAVALSVFYVCYMLLLRRDTFHGLKRASLLFILAASFLLPFIHLTITHEPTTTIEYQSEADVAGTAEVIADETAQGEADGKLEAKWRQAELDHSKAMLQWIVISLLSRIHVWGALLFLLAYIYSLLAAVWLICRSRRVNLDNVPTGIRVLTNKRLDTPCSWMRWVLIPESILSDADTTRLTLLHEQAHVRLRHSWDRVLAELTARVLWPLPFAWMLRRELADVHEYEADRAVLRAGVPQKAYDELLVAEVTHARIRPVVNAFNQTQVKKRLTMMYAKASSRLSWAKTLVVLPLIAVMLVLLGCVKSKQEKPKWLTPEEQAQVKKEVAKRVTAIYDEVFGWYRSHPDALETPDFDTERFLAKDYIATLREVRKKDASLQGELGFFNHDHWLMAQDWDTDLSCRIDSIQAYTARLAGAWLTIHNCGIDQAVLLALVPEDDEWRINDFARINEGEQTDVSVATHPSEKFQMKLYLGEKGLKMMTEQERADYDYLLQLQTWDRKEKQRKRQEGIDKQMLKRLQGTWDYVPTDHEVASHYIIEGDQLTYPRRCDPVEWNTYTMTIVANTIYLRDNASDYKMKLVFHLRGDTLYTTEIGTDLSGHDRKEQESFVSVRRKE